MTSQQMYKDSEGNIHWILEGEPKADWVKLPPAPMFPDPSYVPPYDARRHNSYPDVKQQLDMLWHELNTNGSISANGDWFNAIKEVKETHPKP